MIYIIFKNLFSFILECDNIFIIKIKIFILYVMIGCKVFYNNLMDFFILNFINIS